MIRTLTLRNWRNYDDLTVTFGEGTTFVVASNGIGKTSLVEAARWALFGIAAPSGTAIRNGRPEAVARVELALPDGRSLSVERILQVKKRQASQVPTVILDGQMVSADELPGLLKVAYGAEAWFLAGATMPSADRASNAPPAWRLREHLGQYYGIDSLTVAADELKRLQKETEASIRSIKQTNATAAKELVALQAAKEEAARSARVAAAKHLELQEQLQALREHATAKAILDKWNVEQTQWTVAAGSIAADVSNFLGRQVGVESLEDTLEESLTEVASRIEDIRVQIAVGQATREMLVTNDQRLSDAHADCPVCRRPLDDATVDVAHSANEHDIQALDMQIDDLRRNETEASESRAVLLELRNQWRTVPRLQAAPPDPPPVDDDAMSVKDLQAFLEEALTTMVNGRASSVAAVKEYEEAVAADNAMRELALLLRRSAKIQIALEATDNTLKEMLDSSVRPLTTEINRRWDMLFPDRGGLSTSSDGEVSRMVNGIPLPFDSFSTGEGMGANIVLRLLVTQMATKADFCWFDEPLEHLDPDTRRKVASLLTRATSGGHPFRQVVVTTYEEPLARHLKKRDENWVTLLDVRPSSPRGDAAVP